MPISAKKFFNYAHNVFIIWIDIARMIHMWTEKKFSYIPIEKAHQILAKSIKSGAKREIVPVKEAYNRVLAEDMVSDVDLPPFNVSRFDGYAVRAEDTSQASVNNPVRLKLISKSEEPKSKIGPGQVACVLTGHSLATGSDAVIPVEMAIIRGDFIEIRNAMQPYKHVTRVGGDARKGEKVLEAGQVLRAQDVKLLMELKKWNVSVFGNPVIAMLSVGDELTSRVEEADIKKFDSHELMISTLISEAGGIPLKLGIAPDNVAIIKRMLKKGLKKADIVATIGGSSVGEKDFMWESVNSLSPSVTIRGIKIHPGRVTSLGIVDNKPVVMLPGHIQSTLIGFYAFLLPIIQIMHGLPPAIHRLTLKAVMSDELVVKEFPSFKRTRFVKVSRVESNYVAKPVLGDSSLTSVLVKANGFIVVPEEKTLVKRGEAVNVHLLSGLFPLDQQINDKGLS